MMSKKIKVDSVLDTAQFPKIALSNGGSMPQLGLGTWKSPAGKTGEAVKTAVRAGYRLIDCANDYANEREIGDALATLLNAGEVKRDELFVQAKLWNSNHRKEHVRPDLEATLKDLQLSYVDCFILHWPQACPSQGKLSLNEHGSRPAPAAEGTMFPLDDQGRYCSDNDSHFVETWHAMEDLVDAGLCKSIGLSNFNRQQVKEILSRAKKHRPVVNQCEMHPYFQQKDLVDFCRSQSIVFQSYSPLGSYDRPWAKTVLPPGGTELLKNEIINQIAQKKGKTAAQVVLRWHMERGVAAVAKSVTPSRIQENCKLFDFTLTADEMSALDPLNVGWRHLLWPETSIHPDYPFKEDLPSGYVPGPAPGNAGQSGQ